MRAKSLFRMLVVVPLTVVMVTCSDNTDEYGPIGGGGSTGVAREGRLPRIGEIAQAGDLDLTVVYVRVGESGPRDPHMLRVEIRATNARDIDGYYLVAAYQFVLIDDSGITHKSLWLRGPFPDQFRSADLPFRASVTRSVYFALAERKAAVELRFEAARALSGRPPDTARIDLREPADAR